MENHTSLHRFCMMRTACEYSQFTEIEVCTLHTKKNKNRWDFVWLPLEVTHACVLLLQSFRKETIKIRQRERESIKLKWGGFLCKFI